MASKMIGRCLQTDEIELWRLYEAQDGLNMRPGRRGGYIFSLILLEAVPGRHRLEKVARFCIVREGDHKWLEDHQPLPFF